MSTDYMKKGQEITPLENSELWVIDTSINRIAKEYSKEIGIGPSEDTYRIGVDFETNQPRYVRIDGSFKLHLNKNNRRTSHIREKELAELV